MKDSFSPKEITVADLEKLGVFPDILDFECGDKTLLMVWNTVRNTDCGVKKAVYESDFPGEPDMEEYCSWKDENITDDEIRYLYDLKHRPILRANIINEWESYGTAESITRLAVYVEDNT